MNLCSRVKEFHLRCTYARLRWKVHKLSLSQTAVEAMRLKLLLHELLMRKTRENSESFPFDEPWCNFGIINRVENRRRKLFHQENHTKVQRIRSSLNVTASLNSFIRISETETEKINWNLYLIKRPSWQKARWPVETWLRRLEVYCCLSMDKVKSKKLLQASTTRAGFVESGWVEE